jgi:hypothetical protein
MTDHSTTSLGVPVRAGRPASASRLTLSLLFAACLLAFLLPFATVSCGEPVTFTGLELATGRVAEGAPADEREFGDEIESNGTKLALIALIAVAVGLGLAAAQAPGVGPVAVVGLLALLLLPWSAWLADFTVHTGYVLATGALVAVVGVRRGEAVRRRHRERRRRWPAVLAAAPLVVLIGVTTALCVESGQSM